MTTAIIQLHQLSYKVQEGQQERILLDQVNLEIPAGASVALLGRSGSGKSSLLNLLVGIDRPYQGQIDISGQRITDLKEPALTLWRRSHIGFVYQSFNLIPTLTVAENIALPLELNGTSAVDCSARVHELLVQVGLEALAQRFPDQLSGGEQQRVALARAIAHRPPIILADEPTGNLDAHNGREVLALLHQLVEHTGVTLLIVTHSQVVAQSTERVLTLEQGKISETNGAFAW